MGDGTVATGDSTLLRLWNKIAYLSFLWKMKCNGHIKPCLAYSLCCTYFLVLNGQDWTQFLTTTVLRAELNL